MTTVNVESERADDLIRACQRLGLRLPENQGAPGSSQRTLVWTPDLSAAEQILLRNAGSAVSLTDAERNAIQSDIDGLVTFAGIATPTLAQTAAAVKAQSRILRAILRS
jgi:hypothetical protein